MGNKCEHYPSEKIHTRLNGKIIETNYQCTICGHISTPEEYQEIYTDNCSWCYGFGYHEEYGEKLKCTCRNIYEE